MSGHCSYADTVHRHILHLLRVVSVCRVVDVGSRLLHPAWDVRITDQINQPTQKSYTVATSEPEVSGVRSKGIDKYAGVVVDTADRITDDVGHRFWVFSIGEKV